MRTAWPIIAIGLALSSISPMSGCAREALLVRLVDEPLARGAVSEAVQGYERVGPREDRRLKLLAEEVLRQSLSSSDVHVRRRATVLVSQIADPALDVDLPPRLGDEDLQVRASAAVALAWQSEIAQQAVLDFLTNPDPQVRTLALDGLAKVPDGAAHLQAATHDSAASVRARAASLLGGHKSSAAAQTLIELLVDKDLTVRLSAIAALGSFERSEDGPRFAALLHDPVLAVQLATVAVLSRMARHQDGPKQLLALKGDPFVELRTAPPLYALGHPREAVDRVHARLQDANPALRRAALNAASELGSDGIREAASACQDTDEEVRLTAARVALADTDLKTPSQSNPAEPAKQSKPPEPRIATCIAAVRALSRSGPLDLEAAFELARRGDEEGRHILYDAIDGTDVARHTQALHDLAPLPGNLLLLTHALADADADVRLFAAETLLRRAFH